MFHLLFPHRNLCGIKFELLELPGQTKVAKSGRKHKVLNIFIAFVSTEFKHACEFSK